MLSLNSTSEEVREEWCRVLESGEYPRGFKRLRDNNSFCPLGVLADLYTKVSGTQWVFAYPRRGFILGQCIYLPDEIADWAGIPRSDINDYDYQRQIARANDSGIYPEKIAIAIRRTNFKAEHVTLPFIE